MTDEKQYTRSDVLKAEGLRERKDAIRLELQRLTDARASLSGQDKAAITRRIKPLDKELAGVTEALKDLPPEPRSPEYAFKYLYDMIGHVADKLESGIREEFAKKAKAGENLAFRADRAAAIGGAAIGFVDWEAHDIAFTGAKLQLVSKLLRMSNWDDLVDTARKLRANLIERQLQYTPGTGSDDGRRMKNIAEAEARVAFLRDELRNWLSYVDNYLADAVASWRALNE